METNDFLKILDYRAKAANELRTLIRNKDKEGIAKFQDKAKRCGDTFYSLYKELL